MRRVARRFSLLLVSALALQPLNTNVPPSFHLKKTLKLTALFLDAFAMLFRRPGLAPDVLVSRVAVPVSFFSLLLDPIPHKGRRSPVGQQRTALLDFTAAYQIPTLHASTACPCVVGHKLFGWPTLPMKTLARSSVSVATRATAFPR